jgi:hypothetical protein
LGKVKELVQSWRLVSNEVGVRLSPVSKDVSPEVEENPTLEAVTEQRDF